MSEEQMQYEPEELELHPKEKEFILLMRKLEYGTIKEVKVHRGLPESADVLLKRVQLGKG